MISELIIYNGIINAILFSILLFLDAKNNQANNTLSVLIFCLGFNLLTSLLLEKSTYNEWPILHILPFGILYGLGPLLLIYVSQLVGLKHSKIHLLWFLADYPHSIFHLIAGRGSEPYLIHEIVDKWGLLSLPVLAYYLWIVIKLIRQYQNDLPNKLSNLEENRLTWLAQLIRLFLIFLPMSLVYWVLVLLYPLDLSDRNLGFAFINITILWLGIGGLRQKFVFNENINSDDKSIPLKSINHEHVTRLKNCMEMHKLYLISDLNVRYLEDSLGLTSKEISHALNEGLGKNFYTFINEYRVHEFENRVKQNHNLTLVGVAFNCGFSSKTTFQRVFKEIKGMSPSQWYKHN